MLLGFVRESPMHGNVTTLNQNFVEYETAPAAMGRSNEITAIAALARRENAVNKMSA